MPSDVKRLIRSLLRRFPAERASFDEFFNSTALAKSKFPRPPKEGDAASASGKASSSAQDGEEVIIGTVKKRPKLAVLESPFPESERPAPPPPPPPVDSAGAKFVSQTRLSFRRKESLPLPDALADVPSGGRCV